MRRRKLGKATADDLKARSSKELMCACGNTVEADADCTEVKCWECVQKMCPVDPKFLVQRKTDKDSDDVKPRGWRFMKEFVDKDGTVYHIGEEMPELKGTLPPTDIASIKAKQKEKSKQNKAHKAEREEKKQAKLLKENEKRKKAKEKEEKRKAKKLKELSES
jgi:hypothetical protein